MHAFFSEIADQLGCERDEAERLAVAVIATLEERLSVEDVVELEAELPERVRELVHQLDKVLDLQEMDDHAFRMRVMQRLHVTEDDALRIVDAVVQALGHELSPRETRRIRGAMSRSRPAAARPA